MKIAFTGKKFEFHVELNDTQTAKDILEKLPIECLSERAGNATLFNVGVNASWQKTTLTIKAGDVVYRPHDKTICILHGLTMPICPVTIIGKTLASLDEIKNIPQGERTTITPVKSRSLKGRKLSQSEIDELIKKITRGEPIE